MVGMFTKVPCQNCNGAGFLVDNKPLREWDVILMLEKENLTLRNKVFLLTKEVDHHLNKTAHGSSFEQHDGTGKNNYRGD